MEGFAVYLLISGIIGGLVGYFVLLFIASRQDKKRVENMIAFINTMDDLDKLEVYFSLWQKYYDEGRFHLLGSDYIEINGAFIKRMNVLRGRNE